jgi:hypothetical protein
LDWHCPSALQLEPFGLSVGRVPQTLVGSQYPEQQSLSKPQPAWFAAQGLAQTGVASVVLQ